MSQWDKKQHLLVSAIWYERFLECTRTHGTSEFPKSVMRFYISLINLDHDELNILDKVREYKKNWDQQIVEKVKQATQYTNDSGSIDFERQQIVSENIHELFTFIIQTIQDSGIGWSTQDNYQSFDIKQE
jgi:hypothetical protein